MIQPTVGRVVHYYNRPGMPGPLPAIVTYVHSDQLVNLCVMGTAGDTFGRTSVRLAQPGEAPQTGVEYCAWMPYQVQKAEAEAKTES